MEHFIQYAPILIVVVAFLTSFKLFVRPCELDEAIDKKLKHYSSPAELDKKITDKIRDKLNGYMTSVQFQKERAEVLEYMAKNYVHLDTCKNNNEHTMYTINLIRNDIKDIGAKVDHMSELMLERIRQNDRGQK